MVLKPTPTDNNDLAYIASLSIIYQHVDVYSWVHTF